MQKQFMGVAALSAALSVADASHAQAVQWRVEDGGNGHWYAVIPAIPGLNEAVITGPGLVPGGSAVSISSEAENQFVIALMQATSTNGAWIGFLRSGDTGFRWTDATVVSWLGWGSDDCGAGPYPNDGWATGEVGVKLYNRTTDCGWCWDDIPFPWETIPIVVEWSADCNSDGIVDYGQCRDGTLPDFNGNNIPDCCESGSTCVTGNYPIQWRASEGGNGRWYEVRTVPSGLNWNQARSAAAALQGALASFETIEEFNFVASGLAIRPLFWTQRFNFWRGPWIGGYQDPADPMFSEPAGGWRWVSGQPIEPSVLAAMGQGNPNNFPCCEDALQFGENQYVRRVNDVPASNTAIAFVVEYSADCNGDGEVDFGQILRGQLGDSNENRIPDICENIFAVPQDHPTIQAAIDAIQPGQSGTVLVAAGTYQGPIDFRGRNVVVRGAGASTTTIQGSGSQLSAVVRLSGNEPPTAALERFTVRGGLSGSPIPQAPQFLVGGGLFANESAAKVRDCVFEDNFASYGGGAYLRNSSTTFERCTFRMNRAGAFGGAVQFLNSTASMTDCLVEQNTCESRGGGLHVFNGATLLTRVTVTGNLSTSVMGGISFDHGGDPSATLSLVDCVVNSNSALVAQGGIGVLAAPGTARMSLAGTTVCTNLPRPNLAGPWQDLGGNTVCICVGDLTNNDFVNGDDLGVLLGDWGPCTADGCPADFNRDGAVDGIDLGQLLAAWGPCPG